MGGVFKHALHCTNRDLRRVQATQRPGGQQISSSSTYYLPTSPCTNTAGAAGSEGARRCTARVSTLRTAPREQRSRRDISVGLKPSLERARMTAHFDGGRRRPRHMKLALMIVHSEKVVVVKYSYRRPPVGAWPTAEPREQRFGLLYDGRQKWPNPLKRTALRGNGDERRVRLCRRLQRVPRFE